MERRMYDSSRRTVPIVLGLIITWAILSLLAYSCTANLNIKPVSEMTPKEKSLAAMKVYNYQVDNYKARLALPNLSAAEIKVLRTEYATLQKLWPVIKAYDDYVQGVTTSVDEAVIAQINQFLIMYRY